MNSDEKNLEKESKTIEISAHVCGNELKTRQKTYGLAGILMLPVY